MRAALAACRRELAFSHAILTGTLRATTNAILVTAGGTRVVGFNDLFVSMWAVPAPLLKGRDLANLLGHVEQQLPDPGAFRHRCEEVIRDVRQPSDDVLQLLDGRMIERHSNPLLLEGEWIGRVWSFADVTQQRQAASALQSETHVLELLSVLGRNLTSKLDLAQVVGAVVDAGVEVSGGLYGAFLPKAPTPPARAGGRCLRASCGDARRFGPLRLEIEKALAQGTLHWDRILCCNDLCSPHDQPAGLVRKSHERTRTARSLLFIPVTSRTGEALGALLFAHDAAGIFTPRSVDILSGLAAQAAAAMDNASLYERLKQQVTELRGSLRLQQAHVKVVRSVSRRLMRAEEEQARLLGRELHDRVGGNVSALLLGVTLIRKEMDGEVSPLLSKRLTAFEDTLYGTLAHVKDLLSELRPVCLEEFGLLSALRHRADVLTGATEVEFTVDGEEPSPRLGAEREMAFFRIAQEAWNNVLKHANASQARLTLSRVGRKVVMQIEDDGTGLLSPAHKAASPSLGLTTMRERAEAIGAVLQLRPPTAGTGVQVRLVCAPGRRPAQA